MKRDPERCEFRLPLPAVGEDGALGCALVRKILGTSRESVGRVTGLACLECCDHRVPSTTHLNPIIASLVYQGARQISRDPTATWREREEALRSQQYVVEELEWARAGAGDPDGRLDRARAPVESPNRADEADKPESYAKALGKVGLVGWNTATGLGYMNRDIATLLPIARWLVPTHILYPTLPTPATRAPVQTVSLELGRAEIRTWLRGLDWVIFVELPYFSVLAQEARALGVRVACVPMWELAHLDADWLRHCDLMICPTRFAYELLCDWKRRFGFEWDVLEFPWPVDTRRFRFRRRTRCRRFLFVNGTGGCGAFQADGAPSKYRRKGMEIVLPAARLLRPIPFLVFSQENPTVPVPSNVELRSPPADNGVLYDEGDVCVQPSRWEGLGLSMLECQAAGLPLVVTDAPPMNEYRPLRAVPARETELVWILARHSLTSHNVAPEDLASALETVYETDIARASESARLFIETEHSWEKALPRLVRALAR
jgi:glycosyltransferase involved in cell wall biosynthesis